MRYLLLNLTVVVIFLFALFMSKLNNRIIKVVLLSSLVMACMTMIFDPLIIKAGIVDYNSEYISGVRWLNAPIEDLAYAIVSVIAVVIVWRFYGNEDK